MGLHSGDGRSCDPFFTLVVMVFLRNRSLSVGDAKSRNDRKNRGVAQQAHLAPMYFSSYALELERFCADRRSNHDKAVILSQMDTPKSP